MMMRISFSDSHFVLDLVKDDCRCCEFSLLLTLVSKKKCWVELQVGSTTDRADDTLYFSNLYVTPCAPRVHFAWIIWITWREISWEWLVDLSSITLKIIVGTGRERAGRDWDYLCLSFRCFHAKYSIPSLKPEKNYELTKFNKSVILFQFWYIDDLIRLLWSYVCTSLVSTPLQQTSVVQLLSWHLKSLQNWLNPVQSWSSRHWAHSR